MLLTDMVMPGMSGLQVAEALQGARPEARPVFMWGYSDDPGLRDRVLREPTRFIAKPFDRGALLAAVQGAAQGE